MESRIPRTSTILGLALFILMSFDSPVRAQAPVMQSATVGVVFVEFSDADIVADARGGVGYTAPPRVVDSSKFEARFWCDFFFKEEGHVSHPDSMTHANQWYGDWALT
ncbi:MAG: hypothetical protein RBU27_03820, partial [Bacteroidota bacterium]|nr:hypothetical protein [Bacteroidota bacterium]